MVEQERLLDGRRGLGRGAGGVTGPQGTGPPVAELLAQVAHRARAEAQGAGDGGGLPAALPVIVNALP